MNHTLTSPDSMATPTQQPAQFPTAFISPGRTHASESRWHFRRLDPAFSTTKTVLRGVKGTEECDEAHVDLTR